MMGTPSEGLVDGPIDKNTGVGEMCERCHVSEHVSPGNSINKCRLRPRFFVVGGDVISG